MIAEWLYEAACWIGGNLNNATGIERSPHNDATSGSLFLWMMVFFLLAIVVCLVILYASETRRNRNEMV